MLNPPPHQKSESVNQRGIYDVGDKMVHSKVIVENPNNKKNLFQISLDKGVFKMRGWRGRGFNRNTPIL